MPKLDFEFSHPFQKSNMFYSSTLVLKPEFLRERDWYESALFPWEQHKGLEHT